MPPPIQPLIKRFANLIPTDEMPPGMIRDFLENLTSDSTPVPASAKQHPTVYHATGAAGGRDTNTLTLMGERDSRMSSGDPGPRSRNHRQYLGIGREGARPMHAGTQRASLERVARKAANLDVSIPTSVYEFNLHPKKPLLVNDMGDDFITKKLIPMIGHNPPGSKFGMGITPTQVRNPWPVLDEAGSLDFQLFDAISRGEENITRALIDEGYDAIPYINRYESPGSLSWMFLNESALSPTGNIYPGIVHSGPIRFDGDQFVPAASDPKLPPMRPEDYARYHGITPGTREGFSQGYTFKDVANPKDKYTWIPGAESDIDNLISPAMRNWNFERFSPLSIRDTGDFGGRLNLSELGSYRGENPVELFHGTGTVFDNPSEFRPLLQMKNSMTNSAIPRGRSVFATNAPTIADSHARKLALTPGDDYAPRTYPLHVSASNPLMYDDAIQLSQQGAESSTVRLLTKDGRMVEMPRELYHFDHLAQEGYDAVISPMMAKSQPGQTYGERMLGDPFEIIVPNPSQIKSATGNRGTYNFLSPDITKGIVGPVGAGSLYHLYGEEE